MFRRKCRRSYRRSLNVKPILTVRKAELTDVESIFELLELYTASGIVLSRSQEDIALFISNFMVAEVDGTVRGCVALRDFGKDLLEVRSLVVAPDFQGKGIGKALILAIISNLKYSRPEWRLFTLTLQTEFFRSLGFREVPKSLFPEKIWSDCSKCAKRHCCDETALLIESENL
ncbi:MAG: GNAT family N-acetyltransferase [Lentisphaerae bacterium]|nr:GNAT family N-acetyltransferase [Lentisphaerota bacterium]